jgi:hypothetical protein
MNNAQRRRARHLSRAARRAAAAEQRAPLLLRLKLAGEPDWKIKHHQRTCPQALLREVLLVEALWAGAQEIITPCN